MRRLVQSTLDQHFKTPLPLKRICPEDDATRQDSLTVPLSLSQRPSVSTQKITRYLAGQQYTPVQHKGLSKQISKKIPNYGTRLKEVLNRPSLRQRFGHLCNRQLRIINVVQRAILNLQDNNRIPSLLNVCQYAVQHLAFYLEPADIQSLKDEFSTVNGVVTIKKKDKATKPPIQSGRKEQHAKAAQPVQALDLQGLMRELLLIYNRKGVNNMFQHTILSQMRKFNFCEKQLKALRAKAPALLKEVPNEKGIILSLQRNKISQSWRNIRLN